jgi:hypothetical protein
MEPLIIIKAIRRIKLKIKTIKNKALLIKKLKDSLNKKSSKNKVIKKISNNQII